MNSDDGDNIVRSDASLNITVTVTDALAGVSGVKLSNGTKLSTLQDGGGATWWVSNTTTELGCTALTCVLTFNGTDSAGNDNTTETLTLTVDDTNPTHHTYAVNDSWVPGTSVKFTFNITDANINLSSVNVTLINGSNLAYVLDLNETCTANAGIGGANCTVEYLALIADGNYTFNITSKDNATNTNTTTATVWFIRDATNPVIHSWVVNETFVGSGVSVSLTVNITEANLNKSSINITIVNASGATQVADVSEAYTRGGNEHYLVINYTATFDGNFSFNITCFDNTTTNVNTSTAYSAATWFARDSIKPNVTINLPSTDWVRANFVVNATVEDPGLAPVNTVQYRLVNDSGGTNGSWVSMSNGGGTWYNATILVATYTDGNFTLEIRANDSSSNWNTTESVTDVGIDDTVPAVSSTSPATGSESAREDGTITIVFNDDMNVSTVTNSSIYLNATGGARVAGTISQTSVTTFVFTPTSPLSFNTWYNLTLNGTSIWDKSDNVLLQDEITFRTRLSSGGGDTGGGGGGAAAVATIEVAKDVVTKTTVVEGSQRSFSAGGVSHTLTVTDFGASTVTVTIASTPKTVTLSINEPAYVDIDDDGLDELKLTLTRIQGGNADIEMTLIGDVDVAEEAVEEEEAAAPVAKKEAPKEEVVPEAPVDEDVVPEVEVGLSIMDRIPEPYRKYASWIVIGVVLLVVAAYFYMTPPKKGKK